MRVIAGVARSRKLNSPEGLETRPTADRIKETLFNILSPDVPGAEFLDLFAGSGQIGIEAMSRGAKSAVFVDEGKNPYDCIRKNIEVIKEFKDSCEVFRMSAVPAIAKLFASGKRFDIIFMDPPYDKGIEKEVLLQLERYRILKEDGIIVVEASAGTEMDYVPETCFNVYREKIYGSNKHIFIAYK